MTKKQELITWGVAAVAIACVGKMLGMTWLSGFLSACAAFTLVALLCEFWLSRKQKKLAQEQQRLDEKLAQYPKWVLRLSQALSEARDAGVSYETFSECATILAKCAQQKEEQP